ncbi:MAG TPA: protoglobin domain-containing protein, partial [Caulobacteraceae bacterium]
MSAENALAGRLSFMKLDAEAQASIRGVKATIMRDLPAALERFYGQVRAFPETDALFPSQSLMASAKTRQLQHWEAISSGQFDHNYLKAVTAVGEVHARIGLEPRWYIGGYALVLESLIGGVLKTRWPKRRFGSKGPDVKQVAAELGAVAKATLLDMDLAISVYMEASERARKLVEDRAKATNEAVMLAVGNALAALAGGDLTFRIGDEMPEDYARLRGDFNSALERLADTMTQIRSNTDGINTGVDEIAQASDDLSRRTEHQAASLEQTAAALDQITATVR